MDKFQEKKIIARWVLSTSDMTKMVKKLNQKKHRSANLYFEFTDCGTVSDARTQCVELYNWTIIGDSGNTFKEYKPGTLGGILTIYRDTEVLS
jgi:hypothetical protein